LNQTDRILFVKDIFTTLLDLSWTSILVLFFTCFVVSWLLFACLWYSLLLVARDTSDSSSSSSNGTSVVQRQCLVGVESFVGTVLLSIETQQTIGYGTRSINEKCPVAIVLLVVQSCFGLLIQALWLGLVYTRWSRSSERRQTLIWSRRATVCLRDGCLTLQVRLGDMRHRSTLVEAHVRMYFVCRRRTRDNDEMPIELLDMDVGYGSGRDRLFVNWPTTIEHKIDAASPLYETGPEQLSHAEFEIVVVLEGTIESTGMVTQAKTSFTPDEILWAHRFAPIVHVDEQHRYVVDFAQFHRTVDDPVTPRLSAQQLAAHGR
jgi:hypothetical protein